jgi:uncharacterized glyoxalase superfamily protein PhnB
MADQHNNFAALGREDSGMAIIFLRLGCEVLPRATATITLPVSSLAFTTTGLEAEESRLRAEGVIITMPLREEPWGERLFQVADPNGVIIQLVEWTAAAQGEWSQPAA